MAGGRQKGTIKTGGRQKGTPNKATSELKEMLQKFLATVLEPKYINSLLEEAEPKDRLAFIAKMADKGIPNTVEIADSPEAQKFFEGVKAEMYATFKKTA